MVLCLSGCGCSGLLLVPRFARLRLLVSLLFITYKLFTLIRKRKDSIRKEDPPRFTLYFASLVLASIGFKYSMHRYLLNYSHPHQ